ncbi:pantoate--beta-alanine ligase PAN6 [Ascoidea rubescens DSM 1968]|uniref:Pantoate--beta-alanine ligase n=1 Tax=Ascoidea rubescens DSM 1968 TaxID=1344418 RepID=A0A1D2VDA2_9ASCO|nr:pantothenate synthase [Ascoidea rubescens DSM 1968]ODV59490.1 pantothenate synthase [Ascoidea rubescens DSM 1968]
MTISDYYSDDEELYLVLLQPLVLKTIDEVRNWRLTCLFDNKSVGFVPTMGALHNGHISLVNNSLNSNDRTIVSIFVNPSQFAPTEDLDSYPKTFDQDLEILSKLKSSYNNLITRVDAIFFPSVNEIYPSGIPLDVEKQQGAFVSVKGLSEQLEGKTRPNFFRGVSTVITKFFNIITPTNVYFGQKDIQQVLVIKKLIKDLIYPINLNVVPIQRDPETNLALSSRNLYFDAKSRNFASIVYKSLNLIENLYKENNIKDCGILKEKFSRFLKPHGDSELLKIDYISIADKENLMELNEIDSNTGAIISCAIYIKNNQDGKFIRLIDNIIV